MCKVGDIIVVEKYIDDGKTLSRHSFVVLNDEYGEIQGLDYDIVCNVISSFKDEEQKRRKLQFQGNFPIKAEDKNITNSKRNVDGYIKAEQIYYFSKEKTNYVVIGNLSIEVFNSLIQFIQELKEIREITCNL